MTSPSTPPPIEVSLCPSCNCMTHTIEGHCGKCKAVKPDSSDELDKILESGMWHSRDRASVRADILKHYIAKADVVKAIESEDPNDTRQQPGIYYRNNFKAELRKALGLEKS